MDKSFLYTGKVEKIEGKLQEPTEKSKIIESIMQKNTLEKGDILS
jgi:uncharacterized protein YjbJ (UPF0337 family)